MRDLRRSALADGLLGLHLLAAGLAILACATASLFDAPALRRDDDFSILWGSAYLHRIGGNPYSINELNRILQDIGHATVAQEAVALMWYAPYAFAVLFPFALLPYPVARALWFWLSMIALAVSFAWIWKRYAGSSSRVWIAWALGFLFFPTLMMLLKGQIGWLILLGLVGLVVSLERNSPIGAGLALLPLLLKPHLVYLALLVYLLWAWRQRFGLAIGISALGLGIATAIAWILNPCVLPHYLQAMRLHAPLGWATPTTGFMLRLLLGLDQAWLSFIPMIPGVAWATGRWLSRRERWSWMNELPPLIIASILTSPYGWSFDWVLMMWPLLQAAAATTRASQPVLAISGYIASIMGINLLGFLAYLFAYPYFWGDVSQIWMPWIISVKHLASRRFLHVGS